MNHSLSPFAGKPAAETMLMDLRRMKRDYSQRQPDAADPILRASFGAKLLSGSVSQRLPLDGDAQ